MRQGIPICLISATGSIFVLAEVSWKTEPEIRLKSYLKYPVGLYLRCTGKQQRCGGVLRQWALCPLGVSHCGGNHGKANVQGPEVQVQLEGL